MIILLVMLATAGCAPVASKQEESSFNKSGSDTVLVRPDPEGFRDSGTATLGERDGLPSPVYHGEVARVIPLGRKNPNRAGMYAIEFEGVRKYGPESHPVMTVYVCLAQSAECTQRRLLRYSVTEQGDQKPSLPAAGMSVAVYDAEEHNEHEVYFPHRILTYRAKLNTGDIWQDLGAIPASHMYRKAMFSDGRLVFIGVDKDVYRLDVNAKNDRRFVKIGSFDRRIRAITADSKTSRSLIVALSDGPPDGALNKPSVLRSAGFGLEPDNYQPWSPEASGLERERGLYAGVYDFVWGGEGQLFATLGGNSVARFDEHEKKWQWVIGDVESTTACYSGYGAFLPKFAGRFMLGLECPMDIATVAGFDLTKSPPERYEYLGRAQIGNRRPNYLGHDRQRPTRLLVGVEGGFIRLDLNARGTGRQDYQLTTLPGAYPYINHVSADSSPYEHYTIGGANNAPAQQGCGNFFIAHVFFDGGAHLSSCPDSVRGLWGRYRRAVSLADGSWLVAFEQMKEGSYSETVAIRLLRFWPQLSLHSLNVKSNQK